MCLPYLGLADRWQVDRPEKDSSTRGSFSCDIEAFLQLPTTIAYTVGDNSDNPAS